MAKRPTLHDWEFSRMFGESVVRGRIDGRSTVALWRYWNGRLDRPEGWRLGLSWGDRAAELVVKLGAPAPDPYPLLRASASA